MRASSTVRTAPTGCCCVTQPGTSSASRGTNSRRKATAAVGSIVDVVGICTVQVNAVDGGRTPRAFRLLLQSPADVAVVQAAPWWTTAYTLGIIGVMAAVILGGPGMGRRVAEPRTSSNRAPPRGEGGGRGGEPRQERVPREHEPRDPHPDERRSSG